MLIPPSDFGRCACGGQFSTRVIEVAMHVQDEAITLDNVPQGECEVCGSKVYKAAVLRSVEMIMSGETY